MFSFEENLKSCSRFALITAMIEFSFLYGSIAFNIIKKVIILFSTKNF